MVGSEITRQIIFTQSIRRIANIFSVPEERLKLKDRFDAELHVSFVSDFKDNEFDQINYDIQYVADKKTLKKIQSGDITIYTVEDYCEHMCACFEVNPKYVCEVLGL